MKQLALFLFFAGVAAVVRADLTIVQKIDGLSRATAGGKQVTIKIKGDEARIDMGQKMSTIINSKTGDLTTLMHEQKAVLHVSGERAKAVADMANKLSQNGENKPKLVDTGRKEKIDGMMTEVYTIDTDATKTTVWIARDYPHGAEIMKEMEAVVPSQWSRFRTGMPDFRDFPGVPLKSEVGTGTSKVTTTLVSVKQDPISAAEFEAPADYQELKMPSFLRQKDKAAPAPSP